MTAASFPDRFRPVLWFGALVLLVVFVERVIVAQPVFEQRPALPWGVAFDLLVFVPALFYFMVVRRYQLPLSSVAGAVGACLALAFWLIPVAQQAPLQVVHFLPALLEVLTLAMLVVKGRRLVREYRAARVQEPLFWPSARTAVHRALGAQGVLLVAEIDMLRYALLGWWATPKSRAGATAFSNYRESGFTAFMMMAGVALAVETAVVHLLASHWSLTLAHWLLFADAYAILLLVAHGHAVRLRPTTVTADEVVVRVGFAWTVAVPRATLMAIEPLRGNPASQPETLNLAKLLFTAPNLLLTFAEPVAVTGIYGIRRTARRVAVYLDQPQPFIAAVALPSASSTR